MTRPDESLHLEELDFPSRFLVWAARQWISGRAGGGPALRRLAEAFEVARAPGAFYALDAVMATLACHASRRFDFRPAGDLQVGADEDSLLRSVACLQRTIPGAPSSREALAASLVGMRWSVAHGAEALAARLARLAQELAAGGYWVEAGCNAPVASMAGTAPRARRRPH